MAAAIAIRFLADSFASTNRSSPSTDCPWFNCSVSLARFAETVSAISDKEFRFFFWLTE